MSLAYFLVLNRETPGVDPFVDGKFLAHETERINAVAETLGLRCLDDFVDENSVADFDGDLGGWEPGPPTWFAPEDGIAWAEALIDYFERHPEALNDPEDVLADLRACRVVLKEAASIGARWHFALDF